MKIPLNVLVLCTGNSCRSIIGEALVTQLGHGRFHGLSAGSQPTGKVNPGALGVLERHGVPVVNPSSKSMDDLAGERVDLVITVCDSAAGEACPLWLAPTPKVHWGIPDPAHVEGDEDTVAAAFEATYRNLEERVGALVALPIEDMDATALVAAAQAIHRDSEVR